MCLKSAVTDILNLLCTLYTVIVSLNHLVFLITLYHIYQFS